MKRILESFKSLVKGPRRCGVCLFALSAAAKPLDLDIGPDWMHAFERSDTHGFTIEQLVASVERDCKTCQALRSALDRFGTVFTSARWDPCVVSVSDNHPLLIIDDTGERFELLTPSDDALHQGKPSLHPVVTKGCRLPGGTTGDEAALRQAAKWLDDCRKNHGLCGAREGGFVPTRLLRLEGEDPSRIQLIEHPAPSTVFSALSHRWTQETLAIRLVKANLEQRKGDGVRLSDLPLMMQQVVTTLRRLGIHHVWIDCLCIVQDDAADWEREAARMASIYSNAELTVAATWFGGGGGGGGGGGEGLYRERDGPADVAIADTGDGAVFMRRALPHFDWYQVRGGRWALVEGPASPETEWPLLPRGWVYQEHLLSRRMLHFLRNELLWECFASRSCECGWHDKDAGVAGKGQPGKGQPGKRPAGEKDLWQIVAEYAGRPLTFESDRLPAIAGIAKSVAKTKGVLGDPKAYVCGLFTNEEDLRQMLFWHLIAQPTSGRPENSNIPTWSWASVTSTSMEFWSYAHDRVDIVGFEAEIPDGADPYMGHVESATVTLSGRVLQGVVRYGENGPSGGAFSVAVGDGDKWWATFDADYKLDEPGKGFVPSGAPVTCLLIGETHSGACDPEAGTESWRVTPCCLVLRCVDEDGSRHERIGAYTGRDSDGERWLDLETFVSMSAEKRVAMV